MKSELLRLAGGTLLVVAVILGAVIALSISHLLYIIITLGIISLLGYIVGWFIWGQKPPRI